MTALFAIGGIERKCNNFISRAISEISSKIMDQDTCTEEEESYKIKGSRKGKADGGGGGLSVKHKERQEKSESEERTNRNVPAIEKTEKCVCRDRD